MKHRYQVKFPLEGQTLFGIVETYSNEAKKLAKKGMAIVNDAVLPRSYVVPEKDLIDIEMEMGRWNPVDQDFVGGDELHEYVQQEFKKARELSDSLPSGVKVGKLFSIGVADGSAYYVVTRVTKARATVEWRGFCADRYTDHFFGWGRTVAVKDVARYVGFAEGMSKLFSKKV